MVDVDVVRQRDLAGGDAVQEVALAAPVLPDEPVAPPHRELELARLDHLAPAHAHAELHHLHVARERLRGQVARARAQVLVVVLLPLLFALLRGHFLVVLALLLGVLVLALVLADVVGHVVGDVHGEHVHGLLPARRRRRLVPDLLLVAVHRPVLHQPRLRAQLPHEFLVVRDHEHPPLEGDNAPGQRPEGLLVQVIGGLVQGQDVRPIPHRRRKHQPRLLPAREPLDLVISQHGVDLEVGQMLADLGGGEGADGGPPLLRLHHLVEPLHQLHHVWRLVLQEVEGLPAVVLVLAANLLALVHQRLASDGARHDVADVAADQPQLVLLRSQHQVRRRRHLLVGPEEEAVLDVVDGRLV
mmetsp:Transcript_27248/g.45587  ORF Transcript_27248/g.45587 Transcript_27248/m.45587 type:complete len:357 (-) Transcript_27248:1521-2591(-)